MIADGIRDWLARDALPGRKIITVRTLTGGYRNDNMLLVTRTGDRYVLRRYLRGNTCAAEAALAARLAGAVPVPEVVAADPAGDVAGEPVLLSRFVEGVPLSAALDRPGVGSAVGEVLAAIGRFGYDDPGFEPTAQLSAYLASKVGAGHERLLAAAAAAEPLLATVAGARRLVHSDFNPKNILVRDSTVAAVLDWEFAFAGTPLFDVGNMLRFSDGYPSTYVDGFVAGFRAGGGHLPERWREISEALDLFALADFLARPDSPYHYRAVAVAERFTAKALRHRKSSVDHPL